jgi:hypothetical protein
MEVFCAKYIKDKIKKSSIPKKGRRFLRGTTLVAEKIIPTTYLTVTTSTDRIYYYFNSIAQEGTSASLKFRNALSLWHFLSVNQTVAYFSLS